MGGPSKLKRIQIKPNKKCLDLFGFIRQNREFSMGYKRKNKNLLPCRRGGKYVQNACLPVEA
jgi:hypothetical protein